MLVVWYPEIDAMLLGTIAWSHVVLHYTTDYDGRITQQICWAVSEYCACSVVVPCGTQHYD